jgi:hypothetical protein
LPVPITVKQTQSGQSMNRPFSQRVLTTDASIRPMRSESAACRLGIAAYGFDPSCTSPLLWLIENVFSVSTKPRSGNMRGGATGIATKPTRPITFASMIVFRHFAKAWFRRK